MEQKVLMVILDGFSSNYLQRELCPNLYDISREHCFSKLESMFGFHGVGAAIYSGASSNTTGVFTEFVLQRNEIVTSPRFFQALLKLTDKIPNDDLCVYARHILFRMAGKRRSGVSNVIPSQLLAHFSPKIKKEFTEENSLGHVPTIFDLLRAKRMSYEFQRPAVRSENAAISDIIKRIEGGEIPDLTVIHPCSLDLIGHKFGPNSVQLRHALKKTDKLICRIVRGIESSSERIRMMILSDHGMSPVNCHINLLKMLDRLPLSLGKDYLVFLDSTMARFWFFNEKARNLILEMLYVVDKGQILGEYDLKKLGIDKIGREYGDLIFALKEGCVMFPDFFRKYRPPKGMHGYAFPAHDSPIMITYAPNFSGIFERKRVAKYVDIMPTILEWFNLPIPQTCEGASLLSYD